MQDIENKNLKDFKSIHFIGIGGISMSALASYCSEKGLKVSGSDVKYSEILNSLKLKGIEIHLGHKASNLKNVDLVVYSGAIKEDNEELKEAQKKNIYCIERSVFIGIISKEYKKIIAISGTHGKTTTSSMLAKVLIESELQPTILVGGIANFLNSNYKIGKEILVLEACEYRSSFLSTKNYIGVVLNIEKEHLDFFENFTNEKKSFIDFAKNSEILICNYDLKKYFRNEKIYTISLSNNKANFYAQNIIYIKGGGVEFDCMENNKFKCHIKLNLIGEYNVYNALVCICVSQILNVSNDEIYKSLESFNGVQRRMQKIGSMDSVNIYIDYAHHPTEIEKVVNTFNENFGENSLYVFQPHTYSRTKTLFNEFVKCFNNIKNDCVILPTYSAREDIECGISEKYLYNKIKLNKKNIKYLNEKECEKYIICNLEKYKYIVFLGAGDIDKFAKKLCKID